MLVSEPAAGVRDEWCTPTTMPAARIARRRASSTTNDKCMVLFQSRHKLTVVPFGLYIAALLVRATSFDMLAPAPPRVRGARAPGKAVHAFSKACSRFRRGLNADVRRRVAAHAAAPAFAAEASRVIEEGQPTDLPSKSGVYAIYDADNKLQFVGISRNIHLSVDAHYKKLGDVVHSVKCGVLENATKDDLHAAWKEWLQAGVDEQGAIPPGNAGPEKEKWQGKPKARPKPEIRLTAGKGADDLTCDIKELVEMLVKDKHIVAFVKGTRTQPQVRMRHCPLSPLARSERK